MKRVINLQKKSLWDFALTAKANGEKETGWKRKILNQWLGLMPTYKHQKSNGKMCHLQYCFNYSECLGNVTLFLLFQIHKTA